MDYIINKLNTKWKTIKSSHNERTLVSAFFFILWGAGNLVKRIFPNGWKYILRHKLYSDNYPYANIVKEELDYIRNHGFCHFPYDFSTKYVQNDSVFLTDEENGLLYTVIEGNRVYFSALNNHKSAQLLLNSYYIEQDPQSPHRYFSEDFPAQGDVLLDVGSQEGWEALRCIDSFSHIFLFECDPLWLEALAATFAPYRDKVTIIPKFVGDYNDETHITLDKVVEDFAISGEIVVKMDIEGAEKAALSGAASLLARQDVRWVVCTYHEADDYRYLESVFHQNGYTTQSSNGYMLWPHDWSVLEDKTGFYFRHGLIFGTKPNG